MKRALTGLRTAIAALTLVPMGEFEPDAPAAVPWYPWVGMAFGVLAISVASPASLRVDGPLGSLLVGVVIVAAWAGLSGLMHWDGLADTADGLLGGSTPERRLEIMSDSATGAFGVVTVGLMVVAQVVCVAIVYSSRDWWALGAAPVAGRLAASLCVFTRTPARAEGLGASAARRPTAIGVAFALLALAVTLGGGAFDVLIGRAGAVSWTITHAALALFALAVAHVTCRGLTRPIGGYTGDTLGATIVYVETATLFVAAAWAVAQGGWPL